MQQKSASVESKADSNRELRAQRRELLQELTRQAEVRRQEVRQMLTQSAESRGKEASDLRDSRFETLKKISAEVSQNRTNARLSVEQKAKEKPPVAAAEESPQVAVTPQDADGEALDSTRRWTPGQWTPGQWRPGQWRPGQWRKSTTQAKLPASSHPAPTQAAGAPSTTVKPEINTPSAESFPTPTPASPIVTPNPSSPAAADSSTPSAVTPTMAPAVAATSLDRRLMELEERYSKLVSTLQDQFDLTSKLETLASRLERELPERIERRLHEESTRLSAALTENWQSDLATALDRIPSGTPDITPTEALVEKLATEFQSFAGEFGNRLASFDTQTVAHQMQQRRIEKLEVMLNEHATALQGTPTEVAALQARLGRVEAGLVRAINLLQHSGNSAVAEEMQTRMERIETGVNDLLQSIEKQSASSPVVVHSDDPSASQLLSSLSRLMGGLRDAQSDRLATDRHSAELVSAETKNY